MQNQNQSQLEQVTGNYYSDWFIPLFAPIVIGRSNDFGIGFTTVIWTRLLSSLSAFANPRQEQSVLSNCHGNHKQVDNI